MQELLESLLRRGLEEKCFTAVSAAVGCKDKLFATCAMGVNNLATGEKTTMETRYDMASCSKIMSPTILALLALERGMLTLDDTVGMFVDAPEDRKNITVRQLMTHTSGLNPSIVMQDRIKDPANMLSAILALPLEGKAGVPMYSCFGYITLGKMLEKVYGAPLDVLAQEYVFSPLHMTHTGYNPKGGNFAATEVDPVTGVAWQGIVHDENARFMGGVSANAGVFSDIHDCTLFAQMLAQGGANLLTQATMRKAIHNYTPGFDAHRGLGFHLGGTECNYLGDLMPEYSFGHTGFTGTSFAIDPETGFYAVLLSNRVHPTRDNPRQMRFRRQFHNSLYAAFVRGAK